MVTHLLPARHSEGEVRSSSLRAFASRLALALVALTALAGSARAAEPAAPQGASPQPGAAGAPSPATEDRGWPRQLVKDGATLVYYQPDLDEWKDYRQATCRLAFALTPKGEKQVLGVATMTANTLVDKESRTVFLRDIAVTSVRFPSSDAATSARLRALFESMVPTGGEAISVDRVMAMIERDKVPARTAAVKNDPPPIFYREKPAILLIVEGDPVLAPVEGTGLEFVVNANWDLFRDPSTKQYYLLATNHWLTANDLAGPWSPTKTLPADLSKLPPGQNFDDVKKMVPPPAVKGAAPEVLLSNVPAELILFKGAPAYAKVPGTTLSYAKNTDTDLFRDDATKKIYVLFSGRWFRCDTLAGPWWFASADLPADFAKIPANSPKAHVLASVPGTQEAADAVMLAQIPTTAVIDRINAAAVPQVTYDGPPDFKHIPGTQLKYAINTEQQVILVGEVYYLCFQGVWFLSKLPTGPWQTADNVPPEIYAIPASSPIYNVTYVTQTNATATTVESSHTAGYFGTFVVGVGVGLWLGWGSGYYYPPYRYYPPGYGYPIYRPWPPTYGFGAAYNPRTGGFAVGRAAYGPYGAVGGAAFYNPSTGRYGRAASVQGQYGGRTVAASYNPATGGYARTRQSHNAYAQWGSTVATRGNQWAASGHVSTAGGSVGRYRTSSGASGTVARGSNGTVVRGDNGVYAGRDGNVYKRNDKGDWSQYSGGSWNQVERSAPSTRDLDSAAKARERGQAETQRNRSSAPRDGGGGGARGGGSGARGGGGGARGGGRRR